MKKKRLSLHILHGCSRMFTTHDVIAQTHAEAGKCSNGFVQGLNCFFSSEIKNSLFVRGQVHFRSAIFSGSKLGIKRTKRTKCVQHPPPLCALCCALLCKDYEDHLATNTCLIACHRFSCQIKKSKSMFRTAAFSVCIASAAAFSFGEEMSCVLVWIQCLMLGCNHAG